MQRMICLLSYQFMGFCAHEYVGRFNTNDQIVIPHILDDFYFIKGTLHNSLCGDAVVFFHQFFFQGTAVHPHANGNISFFCRIHNCLDTLIASDISRIDTDFVCAVFHGCNGHLIVKMNICHQRNGDLLLNFL